MELGDVVKNFRIRYKTASALKEPGGFEDEEFSGFTAVSKKIKITDNSKLKKKKTRHGVRNSRNLPSKIQKNGEKHRRYMDH